MEEMRSKGDQNEAALKTMTQNQQMHDLLVVELRKVPATFINAVVRNLKSKIMFIVCLGGFRCPLKKSKLDKILIIGTYVHICADYPIIKKMLGRHP
jgi:formate/nitrite transporter FocA (FNT family)